MKQALPDILEQTRVGFGKHRDVTWAAVVRQHPGYVRWWFTTDTPEKIGTDVLAALKEAMGASPSPEDNVHSDDEQTSDPDSKPTPMPVEWSESGDRPGRFAEYVAVGAIPGILLEGLSRSTRDQGPFEVLRNVLSQSVFLLRRDRRGVSSEVARFATSLIEKLLTRGLTPLPTLGIEHEALRLHGPFDFVRELDADEPEVGWESDLCADPDAVLSAAILERDDFALDPAFDFDADRRAPLMGSRAEARFLNEWVPRELGPSAGHWFIPQAPLGTLLESMGVAESSEGVKTPDDAGNDARRIDFLFNHPFAPPLAIEIDGQQHLGTAAADAQRDTSLRSVGVDVVRITTKELSEGSGPGLTAIRQRLSPLFSDHQPSDRDRRYASLAVDCATAAKVQFAVAGALWRGWLRPSRCWKIRITGARSPSAAGVVDLLEMLKAIEVVHGAPAAPSHCLIELIDGASVSAWPQADPAHENSHASDNGPTTYDRLTIAVETSLSPFHTTGDEDDPDCIIRSAYLPVPLVVAPKPPGEMRRPATAPDYQDGSPIHRALRLFLRHLYRKREFREGQGRALLNALRHIDTIVLLPTGGGKSIIYQLAGLLMPGVTLVVDPLIALMEDQVEGLQSYGIDRAIAIFRTGRTDQERKIRLMEVGQYHFVLVSPERIQSPRFRNAIHGLASNNPINLAVIDEAHCVSEWGHDFRPAYLSLANSLRSFVSSDDDVSPPLLALTGTASRAVLRDMINDLEIDRNRSDALIRPESFNRKEIKFRVIRTIPAYATAKLRAELRRLPADRGLPVPEYYRPRGRKTNSGIVFVPTVGGKDGIDNVLEQVRSTTPATVTTYAGKAPKSVPREDWDQIKRHNARRFKRNEALVLVATKAYGMGIDKPNIRYTIHYGVPSSLEQYYQEAGRAGRDRQEADSILILAEMSETRSDQLLNPDLEIEVLRRLHDEEAKDYKARDDITRALFFHLNGVRGTAIEIEGVRDLIEQIIDKPADVPISLPFGTETTRTRVEKSIYRLYKLGFISDYTVDFGSRVFEVTRQKFDFQQFRGRLLDYARNVAPGKLGSTRRKIDSIDSVDNRKALVDLATVFIEFTYDEIERARRRAIQEAILLARQSESDAEVRRRLLDYLQEGVGYERIDELLQREQVDLHEWVDLASKIGNPIEAGELRGLCIRALESSPDHPGLLLVRGAVETMASDYYWNVASTNIVRAIMVGIEKYDITAAHVEDAVARLFDMASVDQFRPATTVIDAAPLQAALVIALLDVAEYRGHRFASIAVARGARSSDHNTRAVIEWYRLDQLVKQLESVANGIIHDMKLGVTKHWDRISNPT